MANTVKKAGEIIYSCGKDIVGSLDVIVKGTVRAYNDYCSIDMPAGSIIGIGEVPGNPYTFTYEASEEVSVFSYVYKLEENLVALFKANPKLLGTLVAGSARFSHNLHKVTLDSLELANTEYNRLKEYEEEYPGLAIAAGASVKEFPELSLINAPDLIDSAFGWHSDFIDDLFSNEAKFKKDVYSIPSIGLGMGLTVNNYALEMRRFISSIFGYLDALRQTSAAFMDEINSLKTKPSEKAPNTASSEKVKIDDPSVCDCFNMIFKLGNPDPDSFERFKKNIGSFLSNPKRYDGDDASRKLRRDIANDFYDIYTSVFLNTIEIPFGSLPMGIRLFLMFGFVDMDLAGSDNTAKLISIVNSYKPDKSRHILTVYEWLRMIYEGKEMPSKNEFDLDYPAYLKDLKRNGEITEFDEKKLLINKTEKVKFEIKNLFMMGNRVTFGRISTFVPVFDKENVIKPLEQAYLNAKNVTEQLNRIRSTDFRVFYRESVFSDPKAGVNSFYINEEIMPYIILMPNIGSRAALWQEIDGRKRTTSARMIISIFNTENIEDTFTKLIGEFRWEMCKTEQGVHWNDVSDPSLTSMYCDYLQFYRKNSALSQEQKDKLSTLLKNNSNSFKKVFLLDYLIYIKYESQGALRMNRITRDILFTFCPFTAKIRAELNDNPQFTKLIEQHNMRIAQKQKTIQNISAKYKAVGKDFPDELKKQLKYLEM